MNHRIIMTLHVAAAMGASMAALLSCSNDEVEEVNLGEEITFSTSMSRATEVTTPDQLKGFYVWAVADGYKSMFINGDEAKIDNPSTNSNSFTLPKSYFWPKEVDRIQFWAYGPSGKHTEDNLGLDVTPDITVDGQVFKNVTPKQDLADGGKDQRDFLVAYTSIERTKVTGWSVPMHFGHALSQVEVHARLGANSDKIVRVRGAWIVGVKSKGTLSFKADDAATASDEGLIQGTVNNMDWSTSTTDLTSYGVVLGQKVDLNASKPTTLIGGIDNSSLMLIPQTTPGIGFNKDGVGSNGAYILVLCRVEAEHAGTDHPSTGNPSDKDPIHVENGKHYHQLFPESDSYDADAYGYTCVPIDIKWEPGKKYIYTLEFCGADSGAGMYPPAPGEGFPTEGVSPMPSDKTEGEHVLTDPIKFSVTVGEWTEAKTDVNDAH